MKTVARELLVVAKGLVAGDEWADEKTFEFAKALAREMDQDPDVEVDREKDNKLWFTYHVFPASIPLVMEVTEFGYPPNSESLNGRIWSEEQRSFRLPGGSTKRRDPREFWQSAKDTLVDIFRRALA